MNHNKLYSVFLAVFLVALGGGVYAAASGPEPVPGEALSATASNNAIIIDHTCTDLSQIPEYTRVTRLLVYASPTWPNRTWDGFRIGIYGFSGSTPTSLLWGPKFVKPGLTGAGWANFRVAWTLPAAQRRFAAGLEQYYNYPQCEAHTVDNNRTFRQHSWLYYSGSWSPYTNSVGYRNLMIRVRVSDAYSGLAPASIGRVKALYR